MVLNPGGGISPNLGKNTVIPVTGVPAGSYKKIN
jgi:hypothetical protein